MPDDMTAKSNTKWTEQQQAVISYDDGALLVSASAGSGKTTVMLGRILRLISEGHSLKRMLISTFTVSAAEDMRAKLAKKLREAAENATDERMAKRFASESEELASADICTLHKWCQKLIRKYFYVCGDDPAFEIADDKESAAWLRESVERSIADEEADPDEDYADLCACYIRKRSDADIRNAVTDMLYFSFAQVSDEGWLRRAADCYSDDENCRRITEKVLGGLCMAAQNAITAYDQAAAHNGISEEAAPYIAEMYAKFDGSEEKWMTATRKVTAIKSERDEAKKRIDEYSAYLRDISTARNDIAGRTAKKLCSVALRALGYYTRKKAEKGKLDFSDLERRAKTILESEEGEKIRASLDYVFIDEYQDISPLQESIISLLGKDNLFYVGDIKQNIYAFRNCTPKAFADKRGKLAEEYERTHGACSGTPRRGGSLELNRNFRSRPGILDFCNRLFSRIMTRDFGMVDYAKEGCFDIGDHRGNDGSVELFRYHVEKKQTAVVDFSEIYSVRNDDSANADDVNAEADAITRYIVDLLRQGKYGYDDIAILTRSRQKGEEIVARNLRALGIPVSMGSKLSVTEGRVNKLLISMLRLADNFYDDISLVAVMRSPVGGFTDADLTRMRACKPDAKYFYECVTAYAERREGAAVASFLGKMSEYARLSRIVSVGELAGRMTSENKLFATALGERSGIAKADALGRLLEAANAFGGGLSEFLDQISSASVPEAEVAQRSGSVRIMTIHASKGLEFPVVVLCGISRGKKSGNASVLFDSELGVGVDARIKETGEKFRSIPLMAITEKKRKESKEEEMRILYVALTRAQEKLALFFPDDMSDGNVPPEKCETFADWIYPTAAAYGITDLSADACDDGDVTPTCKTADGKGAEKLREYLAAAPVPATHDIKKSVTGLLASTEPTDDAAVDVKTLTGAEYEGADAKEAMRRGTAYHAALERADLALTAAEQKDMLDALPDSDLVDADKLDAALTALRGETAGAKLYREQQFLFSSDKDVNGECDGMLLQGVIDLMAVRGNECEIIDYKTGRLDAVRRAKYLRQLDIYAAAAEKLLGLEVTRKRIYLIDEKRFMD